MSQSNQTSQSYYEDFKNEEPREITETSYKTKNGLTIRKLEGYKILLDKQISLIWTSTARLDLSILSTEIEITGDAYGGVDIEVYDESDQHIVTERFFHDPVIFRLNKAAAYIIIPYSDAHGEAVIKSVRWSKQ